MRCLCSLAICVLLTPTLPDPAHAAVRRCFGKRATVVGTPDPDQIAATSRTDVIVTGAGNDEISGIDGRDLVCSGAGQDTVTGRRGKVAAGKGDDRVDVWGPVVRGGPGADTLEISYG